MGWTSYHVEPIYKNGKQFIDRKVECDDMLRDDVITDNGKVVGKFEVLKSSMVGSTHYAAVRKTIFKTETEPEKVKVFATITLTRVDNKNYYNFYYKDMDESCGPYESNCPKAILDLLTPTEYEYAIEWRNRCYENLKRKKDPNSLSNLPIGSIIKYVRCDGTEVIVYKHSAAYQFKRPFWMLENGDGYIPAKRIPKDYQIIKRGSNNK